MPQRRRVKSTSVIGEESVKAFEAAAPPQFSGHEPLGFRYNTAHPATDTRAGPA